MKVILIFLIKVYWWIIPENKRLVCIYKESCSKHVIRIAKENGFIASIKSLIYRFKNCNNKYSFKAGTNFTIITSNKIVLKQDEINPILVEKLSS